MNTTQSNNTLFVAMETWMNNNIKQAFAALVY